jgi:hypothetical protein
MQQVGAMAGGERHGKKRVQWARGEVAARGTERREVVRAQIQGHCTGGGIRWYMVIGSEQVGFCMEEATYLYFYEPKKRTQLNERSRKS